MKSLLLVVMCLLLIGPVANAAEISSDNSPDNPGTMVVDRCAYNITQNVDPTQLISGCYSCGNVIYSYVTDGWSMRRFSTYWDSGISDPIAVSQVQWGIRRFVATDSVPPYVVLPWNDADPPYNVDVSLYCINGDLPLTFANMGAPYASVSQYIAPDPHPAPLLCNRPMTTVFPANCNCDALAADGSINDLVVAIHYPATFNMITPHRFACAASNIGETAESYHAFADCGWPEPATPAELGGAGQSQMVLVVCADICAPPVDGACCWADGHCTVALEADCAGDGTPHWTSGGTCQPNVCTPPTPTEIQSWGQVKGLYR